MTKNNKLVEMKNIHKWFGAVHAIRGIDFEVREEEAVGLVGDNGAGKSTLIKILTGVLNRDEGEIYYKGEEKYFKSPKQARDAGIETVYQEQALAPDLSVRRNVFMGKELRRGWGPFQFLDHPQMEEETNKLMEELDMKIGSMQQQAKYCSGGEQTAIAIARAMYFDADLIILDEPTRALGVSAVRTVMDVIKRLKEEGIAIIYISHNLNHVYDVVDRVVALVQGEIKANVPKEETTVEEIENVLIPFKSTEMEEKEASETQVYSEE